MSDQLASSPPLPDAGPPGRGSRLSERLAVARFARLLDEASEWTMWLGAAVPPARVEGRRDLAALREASRGLERWATAREGLLRALDGEVARRVGVLLAAAQECLRSTALRPESFQRRRFDLEARVLDLDRVISETRRDMGRR